MQTSTRLNKRSFEEFLDSLDKELPPLGKEKLLSDMRQDLANTGTERKVHHEASAMRLNPRVKWTRQIVQVKPCFVPMWKTLRVDLLLY